jgi:hypothetical protein
VKVTVMVMVMVRVMKPVTMRSKTRGMETEREKAMAQVQARGWEMHQKLQVILPPRFPCSRSKNRWGSGSDWG